MRALYLQTFAAFGLVVLLGSAAISLPMAIRYRSWTNHPTLAMLEIHEHALMRDIDVTGSASASEVTCGKFSVLGSGVPSSLPVVIKDGIVNATTMFAEKVVVKGIDIMSPDFMNGARSFSLEGLSSAPGDLRVGYSGDDTSLYMNNLKGLGVTKDFVRAYLPLAGAIPGGDVTLHVSATSKAVLSPSGLAVDQGVTCRSLRTSSIENMSGSPIVQLGTNGITVNGPVNFTGPVTGAAPVRSVWTADLFVTGLVNVQVAVSTATEYTLTAPSGLHVTGAGFVQDGQQLSWIYNGPTRPVLLTLNVRIYASNFAGGSTLTLRCGLASSTETTYRTFGVITTPGSSSVADQPGQDIFIRETRVVSNESMLRVRCIGGGAGMTGFSYTLLSAHVSAVF